MNNTMFDLEKENIRLSREIIDMFAIETPA